MAYTSISVEGGLFPLDLLDRIAAGDIGLPGQRPQDFGIEDSRHLTDEIQGAFSDARKYWDSFQVRLTRSTESPTTITRENWMRELLELLGYNHLDLQRTAAEVGNQHYFISHRAGNAPDSLPVHIVGVDQKLDYHETRTGRSPHALIQEYLNHSGVLWGIATNGNKLRIIRTLPRLSRPTYLEFDLEGMLKDNQYSEFVLMYRLLHRTRFPVDGGNPQDCFIDKYFLQGIEEGGRIREKLRDNVRNALLILGNAFLMHPASEELRKSLKIGEITTAGYYRELLRLIYRILFLMVTEERKLIFSTEGALNKEELERQSIYTKYYSISRLRERAERYFFGDKQIDLWQGLTETFYVFRDNDTAKLMGLSALNGELFGVDACRHLQTASCTNEELLKAIRELSTFLDDQKIRHRINYAGLDVEEFGSVYESLLDYHPDIKLDPPKFDLPEGSERKQTGSYYTPPDLVKELIESALVPVVEERLKGLKTKNERESALLGLRICDPAAGSGHFLLAAARRVAHELALVRNDDKEPSPPEYRHALRDVIRQCVYAVDKNPLAVDLCKVALWIEGHNAGLPLSFLDAHIKNGDSLVGVFDLKVLDEGIPDEAYTPVTGDDKAAAADYKKRNQRERSGQRQLSFNNPVALPAIPPELTTEFQQLSQIEENSPSDVHFKEEFYATLRNEAKLRRLKDACDLWTAAFFLPLEQADALHREPLPTTGILRQFLETGNVEGVLKGQALALSFAHPFFHWKLEFPDVFQKGGFDVVLGNPPWEQLQPEELKFFGEYAPDIAELKGVQRKKIIQQLEHTNPRLYTLWENYKREIELGNKFIRVSRRYKFSNTGKLNTYAIFAELARSLIQLKGCLGVIIPTGIATDDTHKEFFADIIENRVLVSLFDFENREGIFQDVHRSYKFCLLTVAGSIFRSGKVEFAFFLSRTNQLKENKRRFTLTTEDFKLLNPNTLTSPIFRTQRDAEITIGIYKRVPILINESHGNNDWLLQFSQGLFNMTTDSNLFKTQSGPNLIPLYEAKLVHQFDHRWATYNGEDIRDVSSIEKNDPKFVVNPRYWVAKSEIEKVLDEKWDKNWLMGWRDITGSLNERTLISSVVPKSAIGHTFCLLFSQYPIKTLVLLTVVLNSFVLDYVSRLKLGGNHLTYSVIRQLPTLSPNIFENQCQWSPEVSIGSWLSPRVLELTYTAWDLQPFAKDMGYDGPAFSWDTERRFRLRCELDAAVFHLYGIERDDVDYIMGTFPIVKEKDEKQFAEYRTKRMILAIYDDMHRAIHTRQPYKTYLDPPPGDKRAAHDA